jgi:putative transposase
MSTFIHGSVHLLLHDKKQLLTQYKQFNNQTISAWETQTLFHDICTLYENQLQKRKQNIDFKVQIGMNIEFYKRNSGSHSKGSIKSFKLKTKKTNLCKVAKYLCFCDLNKELPKEIIQSYKDKIWFSKLLVFVQQKQTSIIKSLKLIKFNTGTYRKATNESGQALCSYIYKDDTNSEYKWWYCYKNRKETIHIPLQVNKKYHKDFEQLVRFKAACYVKVTKNKVHILTTRNATQLHFKDFTEVLGIDLNVKHNFCYLSDNTEIDYDRKFIKQAVKELKKLDKIPKSKQEDKDKKKLHKITKRNEWHFKKIISETLNSIEEKQISDVVLENLDLCFGATFIKNQEFEIKYSRLVRILRLSNAKTWFIQQAEKRGIRIHLTNPAYTSQTCSKCGYIDRENRKIQEIFLCIDCQHSLNADLNASINIMNRFSLDVLRNKLHNYDEYKRLVPKIMKKELIKDIIMNSLMK